MSKNVQWQESANSDSMKRNLSTVLRFKGKCKRPQTTARNEKNLLTAIEDTASADGSLRSLR